MTRNHHLEELLRQAGFVQPDGQIARKQVSRAVRDEAAQHGVERTITHTYVKRWLEGVVPRDNALQEYIAGAIGKRLGRNTGVDELGFQLRGTVPQDIGLEYPSSMTDGIEAAASLWQADLQGALEHFPTNEAAWTNAAMAWLLDDHPTWTPGKGGRPTIGYSDVSRIDDTAKLFDQLDGTYGGGHGRRPLIEFLRTDLAGMLRGRYTDTVGQQLFAASARATLLAAWMSYDAGLHAAAQRNFVQALWMATTAEDLELAGSILDAMSHQATFVGAPREAVRLSRSAQRGALQTSPLLTAHFLAMEARGLARLGDRKGSESALARAETQFDRSQGSGPTWLSYFDTSELAAEFAHCYRDLGLPKLAIRYAEEAGQGSEHLRSDFFVTMVLADSYADSGSLEMACSTAEHALSTGDQLSSQRSLAYVDEFRQRLQQYNSSPVVRAFDERVHERRLWRPLSTGSSPAEKRPR